MVEQRDRPQFALEMGFEQPGGQRVELRSGRPGRLLERETELSVEDLAQQVQRAGGQRHAGTTRRALRTALDEPERDERLVDPAMDTAVEQWLQSFEREQLEEERRRDQWPSARRQRA